MKKNIFTVLLFVLIVSGCGPSQEELQATAQASISETLAALPADTPEPYQEDYLELLSEKLDELYGAGEIVRQDVLQIKNDRSLMEDPGFMEEFYIALGVYRWRANDLTTLNPPPSYRELQSKIVEFANELILYSEAAYDGFKNNDPDFLAEADVHGERSEVIRQEILSILDSMQ